jgi:hypothetical protein
VPAPALDAPSSAPDPNLRACHWNIRLQNLPPVQRAETEQFAGNALAPAELRDQRCGRGKGSAKEGRSCQATAGRTQMRLRVVPELDYQRVALQRSLDDPALDTLATAGINRR